jgi:hypothetical protein
MAPGCGVKFQQLQYTSGVGLQLLTAGTIKKKVQKFREETVKYDFERVKSYDTTLCKSWQG